MGREQAMATLSRWQVLATFWLIGLAGGVAIGGPAAAPSTPRLLLDLARDHGLARAGEQTLSDVQHIHTLLRAAVRLDPQLGEAHAWLYELALLRGDLPAAQAALESLLAAEPENLGAVAQWLAVGLENRDTVEEREAWLNGLLAESTSRARQSMIHVHLARLAELRLERSAALAHSQKAGALDPWNAEAVAYELELLEPDTPPATWLRSALRLLELCPFDADTTWQIAQLLDSVGLEDEAEAFYNHVRDIHARTHAGAPLPGSRLLQLARHAVATGNVAEATTLVEEAIGRDPAVAAEAGLLYSWLLGAQGRQLEMDRARRLLARRFAGLHEPSAHSVNEVAQAAWFYCVLQAQPERALLLAENAAARAPRDVFVQRVLGWALAANARTVEAVQTLLPLAGRDPYAAFKLAEFSIEAGDDAVAQRILNDLTNVPLVGPERDFLERLGYALPTPRPPAEVVAALADFKRVVLTFHKDPGRFLEAAVRPEQRSMAVGEPWWAEFSLTSRAEFPITLGPEGMVNPVFLLSFELEGDRKREYPYLLAVPLDGPRAVAPGATVRIRRTIDVGAVRRVSRKTPQHVQRVVLRVLLDPVRKPGTAGQWEPSLGGQELRPVYFSRAPLAASQEAVHVLLRQLQAPTEPPRLLAIEQLAQLRGEQQRASLGQLSYTPEAVPERPVRSALVAALEAQSWELRVRALDALQNVGLDARTWQAATACLEHPHWAVRLMAVRLLGERKGAAGLERARRIAEEDEDELVRALAASYVRMWELRSAIGGAN
jgi:tetratricopeptide (TPR) repeat protein